MFRSAEIREVNTDLYRCTNEFSNRVQHMKHFINRLMFHLWISIVSWTERKIT